MVMLYICSSIYVHVAGCLKDLLAKTGAVSGRENSGFEILLASVVLWKVFYDQKLHKFLNKPKNLLTYVHIEANKSRLEFEKRTDVF